MAAEGMLLKKPLHMQMQIVGLFNLFFFTSRVWHPHGLQRFAADRGSQDA